MEDRVITFAFLLCAAGYWGNDLQNQNVQTEERVRM